MIFTEAAAEYAFRLIVLIGLVGLGLALVRPARACSKLFVWTLVLSAAWLMPVVMAYIPDVKVPQLAVLSTPQHALTGTTAADQDALSGGAHSRTASPWTLERVAWFSGWTYLLGAAFLLLRMAWGWRLTHRLIRSAREVSDATLLDLVSRLSSSLGIRVAPGLLESALVHVPFACGVWRPRLVLPEARRSWDEPTLRAVLVHELAHVARRDVATMWAAALYRALTWVNPAGWWLRRRLEALAEAASDEAVLAAGVDRAAYAEMLVGFMAKGQRPSGRAAWHLAMARPGAMDAERRIARVLEWKGGADMTLTLTKKLGIAAIVAVVGIPAMVLTAGQDATPKWGPQGRGEVAFGFAMASQGDPASIVSMAMTLEPGEFVKVKVRNAGTRPVRRVTLQARVTSRAKPADKPRVFNSAPLPTWIAPGATVELSSGLLDTKTASNLATDGPVRAEFSVLRVEFGDGDGWPSLRDPVVTPRTEDSAAQAPYDANGPGVEMPRLMKSLNPKYTPEAMQAKIEGVVELEVVVGADGRVRDVEVIKSLDTEYGLDGQALLAAREWVFAPGAFHGKAVPVVVKLEMEFRLR